MNKIQVKPEGRKNIWIPTKDSVKMFIKSKGWKTIHNFVPSGFMMIGADHTIKDVLEDINRASRLAIFTDNSNMGHSLALIFGDYEKGDKEKLECYNIGKILLSDLEIRDSNE